MEGSDLRKQTNKQTKTALNASLDENLRTTHCFMEGSDLRKQTNKQTNKQKQQTDGRTAKGRKRVTLASILL